MARVAFNHWRILKNLERFPINSRFSIEFSRSRLGRRLVIIMISCSSLLALLITATELGLAYYNGVAAIEGGHKQVQLVFADLLTEQIWQLDDRAAQASIEGLVRLNALDRVELSWEDSSMLTAGEKVPEAEIDTIIPLYKESNGRKHLLGELHLYSALDQLRSKIFSELGVRLLFNFIKTLIVTGVVLYFFHRIATVHLNRISKHADSLVFGSQYKPLKLDRRTVAVDDELQVLVNAINGLGDRLQSDFINNENHQARLENLVMERTRHLELANNKLLEKGRLATIGSLVAMVAHELRNPLGSIKASVDLLFARSSDANDLSVLQRIDRNVDRCDQTVEQLRRMGMKSDSHWVVVDLAQWLKKYLRDKYVAIPNIDLHADLEDGLLVFVDQFQLDLVVRNILENAQHALECEAIGQSKVITIDLKTRGERALLRISDNGIGLSAEKLERVFDPLYTTKQYGFGMGLSISRNLITSLGGEIELFSEGTMCGAAIEVSLPLTVQALDVVSTYDDTA